VGFDSMPAASSSGWSVTPAGRSRLKCFVESSHSAAVHCRMFFVRAWAGFDRRKHDGSITDPDGCVDGGSYDHGKCRLRPAFTQQFF
jgi:hypothetical protein